MEVTDLTDFGKKYEEAIKLYIETGNQQALAESFNCFIAELTNDSNGMILYDIDDILFLRSIEMALREEYNQKQMKLDYLVILKSINTDKMIDAVLKQKPVFAGEILERSGSICYLDQNVFTPYIHGAGIPFEIQGEYIIPYSPAHILEIGQTSDKDLIQEELALVSEKTENCEILFCGNDFVIFREHPRYCYGRVYDGTEDVNFAKNSKILNDMIEDIRFEGYRTDKLRYVYNSQEPDHFLLNHRELVDEILKKMGVSYNLKHIQENGNCNDYNVLNGFIHNLYRVMDICGVKKDNKGDKIRSSRIDIEHLLYGSVSSLFLTNDRKLRVRARNIYEVLGKEIECPDI